jgi:hypothetical protein
MAPAHHRSHCDHPCGQYPHITARPASRCPRPPGPAARHAPGHGSGGWCRHAGRQQACPALGYPAGGEAGQNRQRERATEPHHRLVPRPATLGSVPDRDPRPAGGCPLRALPRGRGRQLASRWISPGQAGRSPPSTMRSWQATTSPTPRSAASATRSCRTGPILARPSAGRSTTATAAAACTSKTPTATCWRSSPGPMAAAAEGRLESWHMASQTGRRQAAITQPARSGN